MKLIAKTPFDWAHQGVRVEHFPAGAEINTEDRDLIEVSKREGWAEESSASSNLGEDVAAGQEADLDPAADASEASPAKPGRKAKSKE